MRRCPACGTFFEGDNCPTEHTQDDDLLPPMPRPKTQSVIGTVARYRWDSGGVSTVLITDSHEDGSADVMILNGNVRVMLDDLTFEED